MSRLPLYITQFFSGIVWVTLGPLLDSILRDLDIPLAQGGLPALAFFLGTVTGAVTGALILSIGTVQPRKNYARLITALAALGPAHEDVHLVIAGGRGWLDSPIFRAVYDQGLEDRVHFIGFALVLSGVFVASSWPAHLLAKLVLGSLLLVVISFVLLAHFSGASPDSTYIPAHIENGKFVPGTEK